jgi:hypothetical protein
MSKGYFLKSIVSYLASGPDLRYGTPYGRIWHLASGILLLLCSSFIEFHHPIHIAISEVTYSEKEQALQIMHKIFIDDLEDHIEQSEKYAGKEVELRLNTPKEITDVDAYLQKYVRNHFSLKADGKAYTGNYLGKEYETDAVWIYIEIPKLKRPKLLDLSATFLMDFHTDQQNFVHLNIANQKKSLRFQKGSEQQQVKFE